MLKKGTAISAFFIAFDMFFHLSLIIDELGLQPACNFFSMASKYSH
jgi:hypothetical protein